MKQTLKITMAVLLAVICLLLIIFVANDTIQLPMMGKLTALGFISVVGGILSGYLIFKLFENEL